MVAQLSAILNVPPARLLLMREEVELPTDSTVGALGLGITDIIGESRDVCDHYIRAGSKTLLLLCRVRRHGSRGWRRGWRQHHPEAAEQRARVVTGVYPAQSL